MLRGAALQISGRRNRRMKNASVLSAGDVGGGAPDPFESRFDIEQRKFARNLPARFGAKGAGVRDLARRDAMGLLREVVAPEPYAVARRQVVRGKMDLAWPSTPARPKPVIKVQHG